MYLGGVTEVQTISFNSQTNHTPYFSTKNVIKKVIINVLVEIMFHLWWIVYLLLDTFDSISLFIFLIN